MTASLLFLAHAYPRYPGDPVGSFIHNLAVALRDEAIDVVVVAPAPRNSRTRGAGWTSSSFSLRDASAAKRWRTPGR